MKIELKHLIIFISIWALCVVLIVFMNVNRQNDISIQSTKIEALEVKLDSFKMQGFIIEKKYKDDKIKVSTYDLNDLDSVLRSLSK
jgi:hypothetical protein